jgi:hypothetical protein
MQELCHEFQLIWPRRTALSRGQRSRYPVDRVLAILDSIRRLELQTPNLKQLLTQVISESSILPLENSKHASISSNNRGYDNFSAFFSLSGSRGLTYLSSMAIWRRRTISSRALTVWVQALLQRPNLYKARWMANAEIPW